MIIIFVMTWARPVADRRALGAGSRRSSPASSSSSPMPARSPRRSRRSWSALVQSPQLALWVVGLYVIVHHVEAYLIQPVIQQFAVEIPAVVTLFCLACLRALVRRARDPARGAARGRHLCAGEAALRHRGARHADAHSRRRKGIIRLQAPRRAFQTSASGRTARHCRRVFQAASDLRTCRDERGRGPPPSHGRSGRSARTAAESRDIGRSPAVRPRWSPRSANNGAPRRCARSASVRSWFSSFRASFIASSTNALTIGSPNGASSPRPKPPRKPLTPAEPTPSISTACSSSTFIPAACRISQTFSGWPHS